MGWVGKVVGGVVGLMLADAPGAVLGSILGHGFDHGLNRLGSGARLSKAQRERAQGTFRAAAFSTMGHVAKADGRVSEAEIAAAEEVMMQFGFNAEQRRLAIADFRRGKTADFRLVEALDQFRRDCRDHPELLELFVHLQLKAAYADGQPSAPQRQLLDQMRRALNMSERQFLQLESLISSNQRPKPNHRAGSRRAGGSSGQSRKTAGKPHGTGLTLAQAYTLLGVKSTDSDATIKRAYRRLRSQHHPDKLVARGLPQEMLRLATEKSQQIRRAYELIQATRGE